MDEARLNQEDHFRQLIAEHGDRGRLIFADWLDEQGDPFGQVIRLALELRNLIPATEWTQERFRVLGVLEFSMEQPTVEYDFGDRIERSPEGPPLLHVTFTLPLGGE